MMSILMVLMVPPIAGLNRSYQLSRTAALIGDNLQFARQLAGTRNLPVIVSFCKTADASGGKRFNLIQLYLLQPDGSSNPATKPVRFPAGMSIAEDPTWSSLMSLPNSTNAIQGQQGIVCKQITNRPSGRTSLTASSNWFLTVYPHDVSPNPTNNFITIVLDPVTARVGFHQP